MADVPRRTLTLTVGTLAFGTVAFALEPDPLDPRPPRAETTWVLALEAAAVREAQRVPPAPLPDGPALRPGTRDPRALDLAVRLAAEPGLSSDPLAPWPVSFDVAAQGWFGPDLAAHLGALQAHHGLAPDHIVGPLTRDLLNLSPAERAARLLLARDRVLALPGDGQGREVIVELSRQRATVWSDGARVSSHRVLIGRADDVNATPELSGMIDRVVFAPRWIVPRRIAIQELVSQDPSHLAARGFRVVDRHSRHPVTPEGLDRVRARKAWLEQDPGPSNALGTVKLLFDNRSRIALHDTTARQLFDHSHRAHTHGCVRIDGVGALAAWIVMHEPGWSLARAEAALSGTTETVVRLTQPVPVHLIDMQAGVDARGEPFFPLDVYGNNPHP